MKKLILIPTVIMTVLLALAFLAPATASGIVKAVAPSVQTGQASVLGFRFSQAGVASSTGTGSRSTQAAGSSLASSTGSASTAHVTPLRASMEGGHDVATAGHSNCGRFGDGFHGGKNDKTCPNRPFPAPAS